MGAGRNCIIITFPLLGTLASFILALLVVLGQIRTNVLPGVFFLRLDLANITANSIVDLINTDNAQTNAQIVQVVDQLVKSDNPFPQFYDTALWNYCYGDFVQKSDGKTDFLDRSNGVNLTFCSKPKALFWFDAPTIFEDTIISNKTADMGNIATSVVDNVLSMAVTSVSDMPEVKKYLGTFEAISKASFVTWLVSVILTFLTFFLGFFTFRSRGMACCTAVLSFITLFLLIVSAGLTTGVFVVIKNIINEKLNKYGISASVSKLALGLAWASVAASLWGTIWWIFSICCGSTESRASPEEKQPFIQAYDPVTQYR